MTELRLANENELQIAVGIINMAKEHLKNQGIDQWQNGYPDEDCLRKDIATQKGFFIIEDEVILGYLCIDFEGEPAYETLSGTWNTDNNYVVAHRMAFSDASRGKGISNLVFKLVEEVAAKRGVTCFRVDTDRDNLKMQHILKKNGFTYRGTIWFDNSEKIAFDKRF